MKIILIVVLWLRFFKSKKCPSHSILKNNACIWGIKQLAICESSCGDLCNCRITKFLRNVPHKLFFPGIIFNVLFSLQCFLSPDLVSSLFRHELRNSLLLLLFCVCASVSWKRISKYNLNEIISLPIILEIYVIRIILCLISGFVLCPVFICQCYSSTPTKCLLPVPNEMRALTRIEMSTPFLFSWNFDKYKIRWNGVICELSD